MALLPISRVFISLLPVKIHPVRRTKNKSRPKLKDPKMSETRRAKLCWESKPQWTPRYHLHRLTHQPVLCLEDHHRPKPSTFRAHCKRWEKSQPMMRTFRWTNPSSDLKINQPLFEKKASCSACFYGSIESFATRWTSSTVDRIAQVNRTSSSHLPRRLLTSLANLSARRANHEKAR